MIIKGLISAAALGLAMTATAALAQQNTQGTRPADPLPGAYAPSTVNPAPLTLDSNTRLDTSTRLDSSNTIMIDGQARVPVGTDVAARMGVAIEVITNGPVPDTAENRARFGQPMSNAGKRTAPAGN